MLPLPFSSLQFIEKQPDLILQSEREIDLISAVGVMNDPMCRANAKMLVDQQAIGRQLVDMSIQWSAGSTGRFDLYWDDLLALANQVIRFAGQFQPGGV